MRQVKFLVTGGHMTPAFAVIEKLREHGYQNFVWVGHKFNQAGTKSPSPEFTTVTNMQIPFVDLKAGKLTRNLDNIAATLINLVKIPWGFVHSFWIVLKYRPTMIISFGGYLALPIVVVGKLLGKKVVTHEQTVVTGLTNRILPYFADKIFISWQSSAQYYPPKKTVFTGNPMRPGIFQIQSNTFQFNNNLPTVYVTGGNQGSHKLNMAVFEILPKLLKTANVIHQTGNSSLTGDLNRAEQLAASLPNDLQQRYILRPFIFEQEIGEVFHKAALVIARSGANTTYELLTLGKPAIFIPIPWVTHNEQFLNAKLAQDMGLAEILEEKNLSGESLLKLTTDSLHNIGNHLSPTGIGLDVAIANARREVKPAAAEAIVTEIQSLLS